MLGLLLIALAVILILGVLHPAGTAHAAGSVHAPPFPIPNDQAHITDGIVYMAIGLVAIIIFGVLWSGRGERRKKSRPKKKK